MAKPLWVEFLHHTKICGLCGNSGVVDTRKYVKSPTKMMVGVRRYCICPNGRDIKKRVGQLDSYFDA